MKIAFFERSYVQEHEAGFRKELNTQANDFITQRISGLLNGARHTGHAFELKTRIMYTHLRFRLKEVNALEKWIF